MAQIEDLLADGPRSEKRDKYDGRSLSLSLSLTEGLSSELEPVSFHSQPEGLACTEYSTIQYSTVQYSTEEA